MNRAQFALCTAAWSLISLISSIQPAAAQEQEEGQPAEESARKMDLSMPPLQPRVHRTAYVHEGFYLRASVGPGWQWTTFNDRGDANLDLGGNSFAFGVDLMVGVAPSPGMVLGVGLLTNTGFNMDLEHNGRDVAQTNAGHFIVGPFFDAFPDNRAGWHLGAEVGFAMSAFEDQPNPRWFVDAAYGGGAAVWVGHDWWVAPEWSAGLMLRMSGAYLFRDQDGIDARSTAVTTNLLLTVLYN